MESLVQAHTSKESDQKQLLLQKQEDAYLHMVQEGCILLFFSLAANAVIISSLCASSSQPPPSSSSSLNCVQVDCKKSHRKGKRTKKTGRKGEQALMQQQQKLLDATGGLQADRKSIQPDLLALFGEEEAVCTSILTKTPSDDESLVVQGSLWDLMVMSARGELQTGNDEGMQKKAVEHWGQRMQQQDIGNNSHQEGNRMLALSHHSAWVEQFFLDRH